MSISASSIELLVAISGLMEVQDVIGAIRAADAESQALVVGREPRIEPRQVIHPEPRYEPRPVIHPTPRYEARPIYHPRPRFEPQACGCVNASPDVVVHKAENEEPLEPPWKTVPWKNPPPPAPKVKLTCPHPDIGDKGLMLDYFI